MRTLIVLTLVLALPAHADPAFEKAVNQAIDKGVAALKKIQRTDGSWRSEKESLQRDFPGGMTALVLFALCASDVPTSDPAIVKGFAALRKAKLDKTYSAAVALMAIEAAYGNPPKLWYRKATKLDAQTRKLALRLTRSLVAAYSIEGDGWTYELKDIKGPRCDHSHTQLVLLALKAACRLGFGRAIPAERWHAVLETLLDRQESNGPAVKGPLAIRRRFRKGKWRSYKFAPGGAEARGWYYQTIDMKLQPYGSMTAAGIASVLICQSELMRRRHKSWTPKLRAKVGASVNSGLAWLVKHWVMDSNPNHPAGDWHYYHLYCIERIGVFLDLHTIGGHDWYREGAKLLIDAQAEDGLWQKLPEKTCYALLFLERATTPVLTGGD